MKLLISSKAEKQLLSLPNNIQKNIREELKLFQEVGIKSSIDIKKMKGYSNHYRIKIGDYRVRMELENPDILKIYWTGKRSKTFND